MPAEEPIQNLPAPINSDPPDGPTQMAAINAATVTRLNMRFASVAARDAALPNPTDGMEAMTGSGASAVKWIYVNGEWVAWTRMETGTIGPFSNDWTRDLYWFRNGPMVAIAGRCIRQGSNLTAASKAYQLPSRLRPGLTWDSPAVQQRSGTSSAYATVRVDTDGSVNLIPGDATIFATWSLHFDVTYPAADAT